MIGVAYIQLMISNHCATGIGLAYSLRTLFISPFSPCSIQHGFSMSVYTKGLNYVIKLSQSFQAFSQYSMTPVFEIDF